MSFFCDVDQVFYFPADQTERPGLILSSGIHGNESGPIQVLKALQSSLEQRLGPLPVHVLLLYGNPDAITLRQRFVHENLNRLFGLDHKPEHSEGHRAEALETACLAFLKLCSSEILHLDLHSTIKPSHIPRFALLPVTDRDYLADWSGFFNHAGIRACVRQIFPSNTFSQFTRDFLKCDSFTVECGDSGDGQNRLDQALLNALEKLVFNQAGLSSADTGATLAEFTVCHDIIQSPDLVFLIDEFEPNFTSHKPGTEIYRKSDLIYRSENEVFTLFLNGSVPNGQRAGLLLQKSLTNQ